MAGRKLILSFPFLRVLQEILFSLALLRQAGKVAAIVNGVARLTPNALLQHFTFSGAT